MIVQSKGVIRSITLCLFALGLLSGCAPNYPHPDTVVLKEPVPGKALVYFLRAPFDRGTFNVLGNGQLLVTLPIATYAALSLAPGEYRFVTTSSGLFGGNSQLIEPMEITLKPDQRVFYHVSGRGETSIGLAGTVTLQGGGVLPLLKREDVLRDRVWKECSELDARGLITISQEVEPEK